MRGAKPTWGGPLPSPGCGRSVGSSGRGDSRWGLAGALWAPASYPTAPRAHVLSPASSPGALWPRGPGPSACGANGWTGAPADSAFLQREDRAGSRRRRAASAAPSAVGGLRGPRAGAGPGETSLSWGCGSTGFPGGRAAEQLPSSRGAHDGPTFRRVHWYSGAEGSAAAAQARSLSGATRPSGPRHGRRRSGRAPGLRGSPAPWAIAGGWPPRGSAPVGVTASAPPPPPHRGRTLLRLDPDPEGRAEGPRVAAPASTP